MENYQPISVNGGGRQSDITYGRTFLVILSLAIISLGGNPELENMKHFLWILLVNHLFVNFALCFVAALSQNSRTVIISLVFVAISCGLAWTNYWTYKGVYWFFDTNFYDEGFIKIILLVVLLGEAFSLIVYDIFYCFVFIWLIFYCIQVCLEKRNRSIIRNNAQGVPFVEEGDAICTICKENIEQHDSSISLRCNEKHVFHEECINIWLNQNPNCPICRASVL